MRNSNERIKARWDHNEVPTGVSNQRGLLLEIDARKPVSTRKKKRPSVNLAIVIDRSGSMHHGRLEAAKEAAIGIVNRLKREVIRDYSSQEWRGASKLEALSMSKKAMRSKPDFRRDRSKSRWTDFKPD